MADRINEDIRFYLPADPYYYQVDNLPLEDLVKNDRILQEQIDELNAEDRGTTVNRDGINELLPFIDNALPGTVSVRAGNFIGRSQRTSGPNIPGTNVNGDKNGTFEMNEPPTRDDDYNVSNPPSKSDPGPADSVGRTAVYNFPGGNIMIDGFDYNEFGIGLNPNLTTAPLGRIDLVGITTVNGAMDDPYVPGNDTGGALETGDGKPKLAVVKGAGMIAGNTNVREIQIGSRFITVGNPQELINDYGKDLDGNVVPNPTFGTVPMPDDVVNVCMSRADVTEALNEFANDNKNASFFLPLAYVYVPQSHVKGNPIPTAYLKDIRPLFRTAELTLAERQAIAASENPSLRNPFVTVNQLEESINPPVNDLLQRITDLENILRSTVKSRMYIYGSVPGESAIKLREGGYAGTRSFNVRLNQGVPTTATHAVVSIKGRADHRSPNLYYRAGTTGPESYAMRFLGNNEGGPGGDNSSQFIIPIDYPSEEGIFSIRVDSAGTDLQFLQIFLAGYVDGGTLL